MDIKKFSERIDYIEIFLKKFKKNNLLKNKFNKGNFNLETNYMIKEDLRYRLLKKENKLIELKDTIWKLNNLINNSKNDYTIKLLSEINKLLNKYPKLLENNYKTYFDIFINLKNIYKYVDKKLNELKIIIFNDKLNYKLINISRLFFYIEINYLKQIIYIKFDLHKRIKNNNKENLKINKKYNDGFSDFDELPMAETGQGICTNNIDNNDYIRIDKNEIKPKSIKNSIVSKSLKSIQILKNNLKINKKSNLAKKILVKRNTINIPQTHKVKYMKLKKQKTLNNNMVNYFNYNKTNIKDNQYIVRPQNKVLRKATSMINSEPTIWTRKWKKLNTINQKIFYSKKNIPSYNSIKDIREELFYFFYKIEDIKNKKIKKVFNPLMYELIPPEDCGYKNSTFDINNKNKEINIKVN